MRDRCEGAAKHTYSAKCMMHQVAANMLWCMYSATLHVGGMSSPCHELARVENDVSFSCQAACITPASAVTYAPATRSGLPSVAAAG